MKTSLNKKYTFAVGRRKTSSARVRLFKGVGENTINGKKVKGFVIDKPFKVADCIGKFYFSAVVVGGGKVSQLLAVVHGVSRSLVKLDPEKYRIPLKKEGLLIRDPRERQRRMVGTGGKARRKKQSPKR
jgi:small subunit ribosomal protein S9